MRRLIRWPPASVLSALVLPAILTMIAAEGRITAQEACAGVNRAQKKRISSAGLAACIKGKQVVRNAILSGGDLVQVLAELGSHDRSPVRIDGSIIEEGLTFSAPALARPVSELRDTVEPLRAFLASDELFVVDRPVRIAHSQVLAGPDYGSVDFGALAVSANRVLFTGPVDFTGSSFAGSVRFSDAAFLADARFSGATFTGRAAFNTTWFGGDASFDGVRFEGASEFAYARVAKEASFRGALFSRSPVFDKARLCDRVHFGDAEFSAGARFVAARMAGTACFLNANFNQGADFSGVVAASAIDLARIRGRGVLTFAKARIEAVLVGSDFQSRLDTELDFSDASIGLLVFKQLGLSAPVGFARARLGHGTSSEAAGVDVFAELADERRMRSAPARVACSAAVPPPPVLRCDGTPLGLVGAVFEGVDFGSTVTFNKGHIVGPLTLSDVTFTRGADFREVSFPTKDRELSFTGVSFDNVDIDWTSVPKSSQFSPTDYPPSAFYGHLEAHYRATGALTGALNARRRANWARVEEARACLGWPAAARPSAAGYACDDYGGRAWQWFNAVVYPVWGWTSSFSTSLSRLLVLIAILNLLFAMAYSRFGHVVKVGREPSGASSWRLRPLATPSTFRSTGAADLIRRMYRFRHAFALSTAILLRYGRTDLAVRGSIGRIDLRHIVTAEWLLGVPIIIDLITTLTETQPFLQRLLSGIL